MIDLKYTLNIINASMNKGVNDSLCNMYDILITSMVIKESESICKGNEVTCKMLLDPQMANMMYFNLYENDIVNNNKHLKEAFTGEAQFVSRCGEIGRYLFGPYHIETTFETFKVNLKAFDRNKKADLHEMKKKRSVDMILKNIKETEDEIRIYSSGAEFNSGDSVSEALKKNLEELQVMLKQAEIDDPDEESKEMAELATTKQKVALELKALGATFAFTKRERQALDEALREAKNYNIRKYDDNFVACIPADFSKTFILQTGGLASRAKVAETFASHANYTLFGEVIDTYGGNDGWWAFTCITNNKEFRLMEWSGTELINYKNLGNPSKLWMGVSLTAKEYSINFNDAQNSFILIGGKSRSGKTCLSHAMMIQAIMGGMLPTFLDWKPEGSDLYRKLGFNGTVRDSLAWTPEGQTGNKHLLNMLDALAWLDSINVIKGDRERMKANGDHSYSKQPIVYVWDEIAACVSDMSMLDVKKPEKEMTENDKLLKDIASLRNDVMTSFSGQMRVIAAYDIKVIGITQDVMISNDIWKSKGFGGCGPAIRQSFQKIIWGRGTVTGSDCPIKDKKSRDYINIGRGRFGIEEEGVEMTFRALRIDNDTEANLGLDAGSVLQGCIANSGKQLQTSAKYFDDILKRVKGMPKFSSLYARAGGAGSGGDMVDDPYNGDLQSYMGDTESENGAKDKVNLGNLGDTGNTSGVGDGTQKLSSDEVSSIFSGFADNISDDAELQEFDDTEENLGIDLDEIDENSEEVKEMRREAESRMANNLEQFENAANIEPPTEVLESKQATPNGNISKVGNASVRKNSQDVKTNSSKNTSSNSFMTGLSLNKTSTIERLYAGKSPERTQQILFKNFLRSLSERMDTKKVKEMVIMNWDLGLGGKKVRFKEEFHGDELNLGDVIEYEKLFKRFRYLQQVALDEPSYMELISSYQLGADAQTLVFQLLPDLNKLIIAHPNGEGTVLSRDNLQTAKMASATRKVKEMEGDKEYSDLLSQTCVVNNDRIISGKGLSQKERGKISRMMGASAKSPITGRAKKKDMRTETKFPVSAEKLNKDFRRVGTSVVKVGAVGLLLGATVGMPFMIAGTALYGIKSLKQLFVK